MKHKAFIFLAALSTCATAKDLSEFSIRGVSPGMSSTEACTSLADDFPDEWTLYQREGTQEFNGSWLFDANGIDLPIKNNKNGCDAYLKGYDRKNAGGAMTRADSIDVDAKNGVVFKVRNTQSLAVGDSIKACHERRNNLIESLVSKYGKPTFMHDKGRKNKDYRHLIWDYSETPAAREGDEEFEVFQFYAECDMYEHDVTFAQIKIQTEFHSGQALQLAVGKTPTVQSSYQPKL